MNIVPFIDPVRMSNLCQEITLPTDPLQHIDGKGEIALCILSAINVGTLKDTKELESLCDLAVRGLEQIIDHQNIQLRRQKLAQKQDVLRYWIYWFSTLHCKKQNEI